MGSDSTSIPVSLSKERVEELDELVAAGYFESRSDALRYGARLVARESTLKRLHESTVERTEADIAERLERKRVP